MEEFQKSKPAFQHYFAKNTRDVLKGLTALQMEMLGPDQKRNCMRQNYQKEYVKII